MMVFLLQAASANLVFDTSVTDDTALSGSYWVAVDNNFTSRPYLYWYARVMAHAGRAKRWRRTPCWRLAAG